MYLIIKPFVILLFFLGCIKITNAQNKTKKVKEYYENGVIKTKGKIKNDKKVGIWFFYNNSGHLLLKEYWKKGNLLYTVKINERLKAYEIVYPDGSIKKLNTCGCK